MNVGIDIGNRQSSISIRKPDGSLLSIPDTTFGNQITTPSTVYIEKETVLVGFPAELKLDQDARIPIYKNFKQNIGKETILFTDAKAQNWYAETFLTLLFKKLKYDCDFFCGEPIYNVVITVPAYYGAKERRSTLIAALLADIPVLDIISEPLATTYAYSYQSKKQMDGIFLLYDFGDSSLDISILNLSKNQTHLLQHQSSSLLGAGILTKKIKTFLIASLEKNKNNVLEFSSYCLQQLERMAEEILIALADTSVVYIKKQITVGKERITILLDRFSLEQLIESTIDTSLSNCLEVLTSLELSPTDLEGILLTGGAASLPMLSEKMVEKFGIPQEKIHLKTPLNNVALGAAVYADKIEQNQALFDLPKEFKGLSGHTIGLKIFNPELGNISIDAIIGQNLPLPCKGARVYYLSPKEDQEIILDLVNYQKEESMATTFGKMDISSILNKEPNQAIEIELINTVLGTVTLSVYCRQTGEALKKTFPYLPIEDQRILEQRQLIMDVYINDFI